MENNNHYITKDLIVEVTGRDKTTIPDELVDNINTLLFDEPDVGNFIKENFISYTYILSNGNYSMNEYLNAIKFVSFKLMNMTNFDAYKKTYPKRYSTLEARYIHKEGLTQEEFKKKVSSYVYAVSKSKLVIELLKQAQIPVKLLNMGLLQEAINVEADLMRNAHSETVREKAANTLITYLGAEDKDNAIQIDVGIRKDERMDQYERLLEAMAEAQLVAMKNGGSVQELTNIKLVDVEVVENENL